jgi:hypothetical protein
MASKGPRRPILENKNEKAKSLLDIAEIRRITKKSPVPLHLQDKKVEKLYFKEGAL